MHNIHSNLPLWLSGLMLLELQCSKRGWLASLAGCGFISPTSRYVKSGFLHTMRLNSWAGTECSPVSSLKCDRPSHLDLGRLGVVRAAGVDNKW